jgi:hypothetical protein
VALARRLPRGVAFAPKKPLIAALKNGILLKLQIL